MFLRSKQTGFSRRDFLQLRIRQIQFFAAAAHFASRLDHNSFRIHFRYVGLIEPPALYASGSVAYVAFAHGDFAPPAFLVSNFSSVPMMLASCPAANPATVLSLPPCSYRKGK